MQFRDAAEGGNQLCRWFTHQGSEAPKPLWVSMSHRTNTNTNTHSSRQMLQIRSSCVLICTHIRRERSDKPRGPDRPQTIKHRRLSSTDDSQYVSVQSSPRILLSPPWCACPGNDWVSAQRSKENEQTKLPVIECLLCLPWAQCKSLFAMFDCWDLYFKVANRGNKQLNDSVKSWKMMVIMMFLGLLEGSASAGVPVMNWAVHQASHIWWTDRFIKALSNTFWPVDLASVCTGNDVSQQQTPAASNKKLELFVAPCWHHSSFESFCKK